MRRAGTGIEHGLGLGLDRRVGMSSTEPQLAPSTHSDNETALPPTHAPPPTVAPPTDHSLRVLASIHALCVQPPGEAVRCIGSNYERQLGSTGERLESFTVSDRFWASDVDMHLGNNHGCALDPNGRVRCWGSSNFGHRGDGCLLDDDATERCDGEPVATDAERYRVAELDGLPPIVEIDGGPRVHSTTLAVCRF